MGGKHYGWLVRKAQDREKWRQFIAAYQQQVEEEEEEEEEEEVFQTEFFIPFQFDWSIQEIECIDG